MAEKCRNPLKSGQSFRLNGNRAPNESPRKSQSPQIGSVIPARLHTKWKSMARRSQSPQIGSVIPASNSTSDPGRRPSRNPLKSGQSFRRIGKEVEQLPEESQSPQSGQSFRLKEVEYDLDAVFKSQSPQSGQSFRPSKQRFVCQWRSRSRNPLKSGQSFRCYTILRREARVWSGHPAHIP